MTSRDNHLGNAQVSSGDAFVFTPQKGKDLLAHELTHTSQQDGSGDDAPLRLSSDQPDVDVTDAFVDAGDFVL